MKKIAVCVLLFHAAAARGQAQGGIGFDITAVRRYVFRGEVLSTRPALQPRVWFRYAHSTTELSVGAWALRDLAQPRARDFALRSPQDSRFMEWDLWGQAKWRGFGQDLTTGFAHYRYVNEAPLGLVPASHSEIYLAAERSYDTPITEASWYRASYSHGFAGADNRYADFALGNQWLLFPMRDVSLGFTTTTGFNFASAATRPLRRGEYERRGFTHVEVALFGISMPHCQERQGDATIRYFVGAILVPKHVAIRKEFAVDPATRFISLDRHRTSFSWVEATWSPFSCTKAR